MNRYQRMFQRLDEAGAGAFVPFSVLGDPDPVMLFGHDSNPAVDPVYLGKKWGACSWLKADGL
jgi:hypothetical protein